MGYSPDSIPGQENTYSVVVESSAVVGSVVVEVVDVADVDSKNLKLILFLFLYLNIMLFFGYIVPLHGAVVTETQVERDGSKTPFGGQVYIQKNIYMNGIFKNHFLTLFVDKKIM